MDTQMSSTQSAALSEASPASGPPVKAVMVFRFWTPSSGNAESKLVEHAPEHDPGMLALIEDVVSSKRGVLLSAHDQLFVSGLKQPTDALVISRQVQLGLQGFRGKHGAAPVSVSIAIDATSQAPPCTLADPESEVGHPDGQPSSAVPAPEPPHDLLTLLKLSNPAQILVAHDLYRQLTGMKGLPLKTFPGRFGVYEYLWTTEDKLDLLQSQPQLTLAAVPPALPVASGSYESNDSLTPIIPVRYATNPSDFEQRDLGMVQRWLVAFRSPRTLLFASLAFVAIVLIAVVTVHMIHSSSSQLSTSTAPSPVANPAPPAAKAMTDAALRPPSSNSAPKQGRNSLKTSASETQVVTRESRRVSPVAETRPASPPSQTPQCAISGEFTQYLGLAEQDRGRGDYTSAERIFRLILDCDPSNAAAREGLNRTIQGQQQMER
jgi:hypothetical protein